MLGGMAQSALSWLMGDRPNLVDQARRAQKANETENQRLMDALYRAIDNGWMPWVPSYMSLFPNGPRPNDYPRVWIWRPGDWGMPVEAEPDHLDPMMNVIGLYWKPWAPSEVAPLQVTERPAPA